eukprot:5963538-Prorocentrum_lima.AAC.1
METTDMTSTRGVNYAIKEIEKALTNMLILWSSIPCTGGSTWQYVNMANYRRRNDVEAIQRLREN